MDESRFARTLQEHGFSALEAATATFLMIERAATQWPANYPCTITIELRDRHCRLTADVREEQLVLVHLTIIGGSRSRRPAPPHTIQTVG
jgi:hypothetical protein